MANYLDRSIKLLGEDKIKSFENKTILVAGLGGVGGTALNALMRSGFKKFIIVDFDNVDESNLNRQVMYERSDIGQAKVDVCEKRIHSISSDIEVFKHKMFIDEQTLKEFEDIHIDYIVDAIDKIPSKLALIKFAQRKNIDIIVSLGMGNRIDPSKVQLTTLNKTENDPLAKKLRYECRHHDLDLKKINVVFSTEEPLISGVDVASMMMVPSTAGLLMAKYIVKKTI